jgi:hypothetical protein
MRYTYFARSLPGSAAQAGHASRAARTAASMSSGPASATSVSTASVAGLIDGRYIPLTGARHDPPMYNS